VADGVLSDVYSPTIENSDDATLQYIVTDGRSFAALQQRDMTYSVSSPDPSGMVCEVTSTDAAHGFKLVTDYLTDPARDSVVMRTRLLPLPGDAASVAGLKVYARWDATIDNTGGGGAKNTGANDAAIDPATTALVSSDTKAPSGPFAARVTGAVLATTPGQPFTLALGFGADATAAVRVARASASTPFGSIMGGRCPPALRIQGGPTARCSPGTATRRSPGCSPTGTGPAPGRWCGSCSTGPSSPTGASRAIR
jgi:glucoamylase